MSGGPASLPPVGAARDWLDAAEAGGIVPRTGPLVVACSGGLDSVVLLHLLTSAPVDPVRLHVVHVDHGMRPDSAADAAWVHELAHHWGVRCRIVALEGEAPPASEDAARSARWAVLEAVADELGAEAILTAHHRDDQAETVLHHALRGSGLRGLTGMRPVAGRRRRPLLGWTRDDLRRHADEHGLEWREDATNRDLAFTRNRLRHEVLPLLQQVVPGASAALDRLSRHALDAQLALEEAVSDLVDRLAHEPGEPGPDRPGIVRLDRAGVVALGPSLRRHVLRAAARRAGVRIDRRGTALADEFACTASSGRQVDLTGALVLRREGDALVFVAPLDGAKRRR